jgi:dUTP pyrophosphatase
VRPRDQELIRTYLSVQLPTGCYGRVAAFSDAEICAYIAGGVIEEDYRDNIGVIVFSHSDHPIVISHGDSITQLICEQICYPELEVAETLDNTERVSGGFGSTGIN